MCETEVEEGFGGDEAGVQHVHALGTAGVEADGDGVCVEANFKEEDFCAVVIHDEGIFGRFS